MMRIIAVFALALCVSGTAYGQTPGADPVAACRAANAGDSAAHIACLENAIAAMRAAPAPAPAAPSEAAAAPRRFTFSPAPRAQEVPPVRVRIVQVSYNHEGLGRFVTDEGQIWRETTPAPSRRHLEPGESYEAEIGPGLLGGYRMNVDGIRWEYKVEPLN